MRACRLHTDKPFSRIVITLTEKEAKMCCGEKGDNRFKFVKDFYLKSPKGRRIQRGLEKEFRDNTLGSAERWNLEVWLLEVEKK